MKTILKKLIPFVLIIIAILTIGTSCNKDENENPLPIQNDFTKNFGNEVNRDFIGKIVDKNGNPVEDVSIKVGGELTSTDENGVFKIEDASVYEKFAYITAKKSGFIEGSRSLVPTSGTNQIDIILLEEFIAGTVPSGSDSQISLPDGTTIKFDGNFKTQNGDNYSGNVTVLMNRIDASDEEMHKKMPAMLYGESTENEERLLNSKSMVYIELRNASGEKLKIDRGHATLKLPLNNFSNSLQPFLLNSQHGYWVETGTPISQQDNYYDFEIPDLNGNIWVDFDVESILPAKICMTIFSNQTGEPLKGFYIYAVSSDNGDNWSTTAKTDENGQVCLLVPKNKEIIIGNNECLVATLGEYLYIGTVSAGILNLGTLYTDGQIVKINGLLLTCDGNAVADGYVVVNYYGKTRIKQVTNGFFEIDIYSCDNQYAPEEFIITGYDNINHQHTNEYVGYVDYYESSFIYFMACESMPEYISFKIDDNPIITYTNIITNSNSNSFSIYGSGIDSATEYIQISGNSTTLGSYNSPFFDLVEFYDRNHDTPTNIQFTLVNYGAYITEYIDINFSGTYTDTNGVIKNITGTAHVKRDN